MRMSSIKQWLCVFGVRILRLQPLRVTESAACSHGAVPKGSRLRRFKYAPDAMMFMRTVQFRSEVSKNVDFVDQDAGDRRELVKTVLPSHIQTSRRLKRTSMGMACLLAAILSWVYGFRYVSNSYIPAGVYHTRNEISQKALRIAAALQGPSQLVMSPVLHVQRRPCPQKHPGSHSLWIVLCEARHQQMNMLFDDRTGRLICLIMDNLQTPAHSGPPRLRTQADAMRMGVQRLESLDVLPSGAEIALSEAPHRVNRSQSWGMTWRVRSPAFHHTYQIKMRLDSDQGLPTDIFDTRQSG